jgi:ABC-2 type transport system ATP-binding protein
VLEELIKDMAENGQTIIFSTHVMQHAERLCDQILLISGGKKIFDGTLTEAKGSIPRRVVLETSEDIQTIEQLDGVISVKPAEQNSAQDAATEWLVEIEEYVNPQDVLRHCFEADISLNRFEFSEPSLHDVFVHLVGDEAREHSAR